MDLLSMAAVRVPCPQCSEPYSVPLWDILQSHEIMHEGCPATETECPPAFQSRLASREAVRALEQAWKKLEREAKRDGGELVLMGGVEPPAARSSKDKSRAQPAPPRGAAKRKTPRRAA